ncbi:MAG: ABC transporter ATP-binding protein [Balneolaceae bacterium]
MNPVVQISDLSKSFGIVNALKEISLEIHDNELFGFIGPDGAGKTTLFRILTTLLIPNEGTVRVMGMDVVSDYKKIRPLLGYMPGTFSLYQDLSVEENMKFFASVFGTTIEENYDLVKPIYRQLEPFKDRYAGNLSGGMKQKLALSCALIHKPKLLILDEPTTGVDAVSRKEFWEMLHLLKEEGISIIASTPYMDEANQCDRIALIDKGSVLNINTPDNVISGFEKPLYGLKHPNKYALINHLREFQYSESVHPFGEFVHYTDSRGKINTSELKNFLEGKGLNKPVVKEIEPDIEDMFMSLMKPEEIHV